MGGGGGAFFKQVRGGAEAEGGAVAVALVVVGAPAAGRSTVTGTSTAGASRHGLGSQFDAATGRDKEARAEATKIARRFNIADRSSSSRAASF